MTDAFLSRIGVTGSLDRIRNALDSLRARLWLIPAVFSVLGAVAARLASGLDDYAVFSGIDAWWWFGGEADTARGLLGTLLSGMLTMTSLVVSITMVVLSLAANQLGPRLIWNFIRDRQIQVVIGLFFGTIVYILVTLRSVHEESVPSVAVTLASALAAACLFALLFHVHKVANSIVADTVVNEVADELERHIRSLTVPQSAPGNAHDAIAASRTKSAAFRTSVAIGKAGYVQVVDLDRLLKLACSHDLVVHVEIRAGQHVLAHGEHLIVSHDAPIGDDVLDALRSSVLVGRQRTATQDVEYSVRQLVEIAVRALSPGVNDPFTAEAVVHRLCGALEVLACANPEERVMREDLDGIVRVVARSASYAGVANAALNQIRQAAAAQGDVAVLIAMSKGLGHLAAAPLSPDQRHALSRHLGLAGDAATRSIPDESDRADLLAAVAQAHALLRGADGPDDIGREARLQARGMSSARGE